MGLPTIIFQGQAVSFREGRFQVDEKFMPYNEVCILDRSQPRIAIFGVNKLDD